ncbi:MAG: hypothetical protein LBD73_06850 [Deferribacteraceae bacterium]|jgi:hypothetical protein|nr:hypothetical protein [Deferribacteraceae bacterium]
MDKSEGSDVISKFFGSISDGVSKLYLKGQNSLAKLSLQRTRSEKITELGAKLFKLLDSSLPVSAELFKEEYDAIVRIDKELAGQDLGVSTKEEPPKRRGGRRKKPEKDPVPAPKGRRGKKTPAESAPAAPKVKRSGRVKKTESEAAAPKLRRGGRKKAAVESPSAANESAVSIDERKELDKGNPTLDANSSGSDT